MTDSFAERVIRWQSAHGRSDLPWQQRRDPYRIWLSEIMLQQTQVATVREYFLRFLKRFPDVAALAAASADEVLAVWSGLGYYSRARNLHRCAQEIVQQHGGEFPRSAAALQELPGIGRSTAAAIAAFCFGERVAILDGNVKRVLARFAGFDLDLAVAANERALWDRATALLPERDLMQAMPRYTQALMDLGATVCHTRRPSCGRCPLEADCVAHREGDAERLPIKTRRTIRRNVDWWLLLMRDPQGRIWLERRQDGGIWAGLFCAPVFERREALDQFISALDYGLPRELTPFNHALTHRELKLHPIEIDVSRFDPHGDHRVAEPTRFDPASALQTAGRWVDADALIRLGLPAPMRKLLVTLQK